MRHITIIKCSLFLLSLVLGLISCKLSGDKENLDEQALFRRYCDAKLDSTIWSLDILDSLVVDEANIEEIKAAFAQCRLQYKHIEPVVEYYFQGLTKRINGPALPDVKTEDGVVWDPHGYQVLEQLIYEGFNDSSRHDLSDEIKVLQTDLRQVKGSLLPQTISRRHVYTMIQQQLIRIATLGLTASDSPISFASLKEISNAIIGLERIHSFYAKGSHSDSHNHIVRALDFLKQNDNFDQFDRLTFIVEYLMPLSKSLSIVNANVDSMVVKPFSGSFTDYFRGKGFSGDYYTTYSIAKTNPLKVALGKKLFFDISLSRSSKLSCGTCHKPELYFTDGQQKASNIVHGGQLLRNTPTLYYSSLQSHQFYDMRAISIEDQINDVMTSSKEFNYTPKELIAKISSRPQYRKMFQSAFAGLDTISSFAIRNSIASYVKSLNPFSSDFDKYMRGDSLSLTAEQKLGFNLFMGKAKCGSCHFAPVFNGNIPPWLLKSESEVIGVPSEAVWKNAKVDPDKGRYDINKFEQLKFAFKTPTVRNAEKTAPYMHNGVYTNLDDVVEFYSLGGGSGIGIDLQFQTLPFDSLSLDKREKKAIVAFIRALTDETYK